MTSIKDAQNIYGYTGKRKESYNFFRIRSPNGKVCSLPEKPNTQSSSEVQLKSKWINPIRSIRFLWTDENWILNYVSNEQPCLSSLVSGEWFMTDAFDTLTFTFWSQENPIVSFQMKSHEKGYCLKMDQYGIFASIRTDGDQQTVEFSTVRPKNLKVHESKLFFEQKEYPFSFQFEENPECDAIFNDFISTHLPQLRSPDSYVVPVKQTTHRISYRQYIGGYMKTKTLFQFIIKESGWCFEDRIEDPEAPPEMVRGVDIHLRNEWTYFPWGSRIEHCLYFI